MTWLLAALCAIAGLYQLVAIAACIRRRKPPTPLSPLPPISILKPVRGVTPFVMEAIRTHLEQDYPDFELLLGVREDESDALAVADPRARIVLCRTTAPNGKVGSLIDLARAARHSILIVNDADIAVPPGYLRALAAELSDPKVGLATCLYRVRGATWPGRWEGLGVSTDFAPSALVAPFVGISEFGLGATLAFRGADLDRAGGFAAVADYLADDYQLGCKLHALGLRNVMARPVVSTSLAPATWGEAWRHQVRWARTVRLSRTGGFIGLPVTFATFWAAVAALSGLPWLGAGLLAIRLAMALIAGYGVLRDPEVLRLFVLIPVRDLYAVAVWAAALFGNAVEWGGEILRLDRSGRIVGKQPRSAASG